MVSDDESVRPEDLAVGDTFVFNGRSQPCTVELTKRSQNARFEGTIRVIYEVEATGPQGADITLQRTGTGRIRVSPTSGGPHANVHSLSRVSSSKTPSRETELRRLAEELYE